MTEYIILSFAILITAILVYLIAHYHAKLRDKDDPKFLIIIGVLIVLVADTWISIYGSTVKEFFATYHFLLSAVPLAIYGLYLLFTRAHRKERAEKERIKHAFSRYVIPEIIDELLEDPSKLKLGGEERRLAILFADIRGFTTISEQMPPAKLVHMLNLYFSRMTEVILDKRGSIDKFIGDAIMAFWGAPVDEKQNSVRACAAAMLMIEELERLKKSAAWQAEKLPDINIGIGINTGTVIVGNVGSESRYDYTALGDEVNLASRLEGLTKMYGVNVLVSEQTVKDLGAAPARELDSVFVKGKKHAVKIYELLTKEQAKKHKDMHLRYSKALLLYRQRKFAAAEKLFLQNKADTASSLMASRCRDLAKQKLAKDWNGSFEMKTK